MDVKKIYDTLPSSWQDIRLKDFIKLTDINIVEQHEDGLMFVGVENSFKVLSKLSGIENEELEAVPISQIIPLMKKIEFVFNSNPDIKAKSSIRLKRPAEISYNDFITFQALSKEPFKNLHLIIKAFMKNEMSDEQILELPLADVFNTFFLQQRQVKRFLRNTKRYLIRRLLKLKVKELVSFKKK